MRLSVVITVTGVLVRLFGTALTVPLLLTLWYREWSDVGGFAIALVVTIIVGALMRRAGSHTPTNAADQLRRIEGLAVVAATWLLMAHLAAIPYLWTGFGFIDALFESMSGLTTTGATILTDFDSVGHGILFWRSLTQWLGGMGVIALFIAILPRLAIGGRQLFFAETPGVTEERLTPQLRQTALRLWQLYAGLTVTAAVALMLAGMPVFDAVCHAMTTLAAGGFSPHAQSISGYDSALIDWIVVVFMVAAGANFALQYRTVRGNYKALVRDEEFRVYLGVVLAAVVAVWWFLVRSGTSVVEGLRAGAFQVVSILTTTGYASTDFDMWSDQAKMVLFLLMFIGGSAGSAAGGPKIVRHLLMARYAFRELRQTLHPRAMLLVKLGGRVVPENILRDVQVFMLFYLLTFAVGATVVVSLGADLVTGITASIACLGNIGPGFGEVGPMSNFATLHPVSKVVLTLLMWIGRLEVLTVLIFFRLEPWRTSRWGGRQSEGLSLRSELNSDLS